MGEAINSPPATGTVVAAHGRNFLVELDAAGFIQCVTRGKDSALACGDRVQTRATGPAQGVIESTQPRDTLFQRSSNTRAKLLAANATQLALVTATEPSFSDELIVRALCAARLAGLRVLLVLNKCDLGEGLDAARARLAIFDPHIYPVLELNALGDIEPLREHLAGERTVLAGQSGMGKSTIINALFPEENAATRSVSYFLSSGRHTTTAARLYRFDANSWIVDTPGMQEFGIAHLDRANIEAAIPEFKPYLGHCRFQNCKHGPEPGCAVKAAVERGDLPRRRWELFLRASESP